MNLHVPNSFELAKLQCNDNTSRALSFLLRRPGENLPLTECIYRVQGEILKLHPSGVLLRNVISGTVLLSAETAEGAAELLDALPENPPSLLVTSPQAISPPPGFAPAETLVLLRWPGFQPPSGKPGFEIWPLDQGDLPAAMACGVPPAKEEALSAAIARRQVYGACIDDAVAGTVGINGLGGIDFLSVSPSLRGRGMGKALLSYQIRQELRAGHIPFALIAKQNAVAIALAEKVGMERQADVRLHTFINS